MTNDTYRIGIDVGRNSVGLCALAVDDAGVPIKFLNSSVFIHDAGADPKEQDHGYSRKKVAGIARRTRRLYRNRRYRLRALDKFLVANGYPIVNLESFSDPYTPWKMRLQLLTEKLPEDDMKVALSVAVRHIARHRGWRSPYEKVATLYQQKDPSDELLKLREKVLHATGVDTDEDVTPAELISEILGWGKIRGEAAESKSSEEKSSEEKSSEEEVEKNFSGKLRQSDNANEIRKYGQIQGLGTDFVWALIDKVFYAKSPVGSAQGKIGHDSLPGQQHLLRVEKADPIFQRYRIVSTLMNLRIKVAAGEERSLDKEELLLVTEYLMNYSNESAPNWGEVAEKLGIERASLRGTATLGPDGERASLRPPINVTGQRILENKKSAALKSWWKEATPEEQSCLISLLSFAQNTAEDEPGYEGAFTFLHSLDDIELSELDTLKLPAGRAAYSRESLMRLTNRMLEDGVDLYEARRLEFGVAEDWKPVADPIGEPVGNPGVDRVLKIVNRWLQNVTKKWGAPAVINIEHVREAFSSEEKARKYSYEINQRYKRNEKLKDLIAEETGMSRVDARDITKYLAVRRQDSQCLYCGDVITFSSAEMDHIIPRRGVGATNKRENLAAVCRQCNQKKSDIPLAVWVAKQSNSYITMDAIRERVYNWKNYNELAPKQWETFKKDVLRRLEKTDADPEIDGRSMESVAWMARELQKRIEYFYRESGTEVQVFRGQLTAEARKASGFEKRVQFIGGSGKTRLDRRHHAMDAAVISLMDFNIATTLAERTNLRTMQRYRRFPETWKTYAGRSEKMQLHYAQWQQKMEKLLEIFNDLLREDLIPVMYPIRLQLGNSKLHNAEAGKLGYKILGEAWIPTEVDRAATPQMWTALTRLPEYSRESGLPEDSGRCLRIKGQYFQATAALPIFLSTNKKGELSAAVMLRGCAYQIDKGIHHGRIYRILGKTPSYGVLRVYSYDLLPYRKEDLFTVQLPDSSLSMRIADSKVRRAIENGSAEYLGWIVAGDEIEVDFSNPYFRQYTIGEFLAQYPEIHRFRVTGFEDSTRINMKPLLLAAEGLTADATKAEKTIIDSGGWRATVNKLFSEGHPRIIRRNTLGEIRRNGGHSSLPLSWQF